ncbi:hypothetical protein E8E13_004224 [Curvularia kusanoi]|uniref:F-box domain-containing protein n=1 Tax=Curvularia kusanoi TaxID=90978 RepID=A0A9P4T530_CURKU|nr:hypothetical protein E8E13_004224 [Curvularia kusanoi]
MSDPLDHPQPFAMADVPTDIRLARPGDPDYLSRLPPELLRLILQQLLPQDLAFGFEEQHEWSQSQWILMAKSIDDIFSFGRHVCKNAESCPWGFHMNHSIYYVSRKIASEARAVFFSGNVFRFHTDAEPQLKPSQIFGPLEQRYQKNVLRELQRMQIVLRSTCDSFERVRRRRSQLQHVVNMLGDHGENTVKALLRSLEVRDPQPRPIQSGEIDKSMFALEVLSGLKGLTEVKFEGIPSWFSECLVLQLTSRGGPSVSVLSWPTTMKKHKKKQKLVTSRAYWQPTLDWKEYAIRNGIELPADVDIYFPPSQ